MTESKHWNETKPSDTGIARCPFPACNARVIARTDALNSTLQQIKNPPMMLKTSSQETLKDPNGSFFQVGDVWEFDNIGVSRPAGELEQPEFTDSSVNFKIDRLLVCSECDRGPLGFAGFFDGESDVHKLECFLSCSSVVYNVDGTGN